MTADQNLTIVVRRVINAAPARVFAAWTEPRHIVNWWGPKHVTCEGAEIDLRVDGTFRIGNLLPDGATLWIAGEYLEIVPAEKLVFSWRIEGKEGASQHVTVAFAPLQDGAATEVCVTHEKIPDQATCDDHEAGWIGCLDGLADYF